MIKKTALLLFVIGMAALGCRGTSEQKYLIILQAGTQSQEGTARAMHALLYATELKEAGYPVVLSFDGAGTEWAKAFLEPENELHGAYVKLRDLGVTQVICDFCSRVFHVQEDLAKGTVPIVAEFQGHPSLVKWIKQGYLPLVL